MRAVHAFAAIAMTGILAIGTGAPVQAAAPVPANRMHGAAKPPQPSTARAAAEASASARAVATGDPVVVSELTTPTSLTMALPGGAMRLEQSTLPVRVRQGDGWVPVDTDLVREGDWLSPVASAVPVRFSPGGGEVISQTQTLSGEWVSESWMHGPLPAPSVEGDTATYAEVLPGVDLKLVATKSGMASIYVVKSEEAARGSGLAGLQVAVDGAQLTNPEEGRVAATAVDGSSLIAAQPLWWDSSGGGTYREPGEEAPPAPVTHVMSAGLLTMDVGASVAVEEARDATPVQYPIFVDPDWSAGGTAEWYTDAAYPNASYLTAGASDVLRVGAYAQYRSDMFFEFPLDLAGSDVLSAVLDTTQLVAAACPAGWISSHYVSIFAPGYTWNQEQARKQSGQMWWSGTIESQQGAGCGAGPTSIGWTMTDEVAAIVDTGAEWVHFGFTGEDNMSRKHFSRDATLIVEYNNPPDVPTNPKFVSPSAPCGTAAVPTVIGASNVTVQVDQTDPDAGNVDTNFHLYKASNLNKIVQDPNSGMMAQGIRTATFTNLAEGKTYAWEAIGSDWLADGVGSSELCYFTVRTTGPAHLPTISLAAGPYMVGTATTATFTVDPADGVAFIAYTVAPASVSEGFVFDVFSTPPACGASFGEVRIACPGASSTVSVPIAPTAATSTVWAVSYDRAGNPARVAGKPVAEAGKHGASLALTAANSAAVSFATGHVWRTVTLTSPLGGTVPDSNVAGPVALTLGKDTLRTVKSNPLSTSGPQNKPVLAFADPATTGLTGPDRSSTATGVVSVDQSFTIASWVKPAAGGAPAAVSAGADDAVTLGATATAWQFCVRGGAGASTCTTAARAPGARWAHIAGVSDAVNKRLRLYVNGMLVASVDGPGSMPAPVGAVPVAVGAAVSGGVVTGRWSGQVADPALFEGVATANQLSSLRTGQDPANG